MDSERLQEECLRTANRFGKMKYELLFKNVSKAEFSMMMVIYRYRKEHPDERGIYVSQLARTLHVSSPAVSRMIGTMEEKGYIGRDIDKEDRRNTFVYLTEEGICAREQSEKRMHKIMNNVLLGMGEENMQELMMLMNKLADIVEKGLKEDI